MYIFVRHVQTEPKNVELKVMYDIRLSQQIILIKSSQAINHATVSDS
jgi:hypothetical protein